MPDIFKALASITAWVLFIVGLLGLVTGSIGSALGGQFFGAEPPAIQVYLGLGLSVVTLVLSVCTMRLRQKME
jgi:uncharacterized membrane protein YoaK (UPF0700 family)